MKYRPTKPTQLIIAIVLVAIIGLSLVKFTGQNGTKETSPEDGSRYSGPTEQEIKDVDSHKQQLANSSPKQTGTNEKHKVNPVITSVDVNELRGFIGGVVEDNGTCTATYTNGSASFTKTSKGTVNASNTLCGVITTKRSDFSESGTWSVTLAYSSDTAEGVSSATTLEVQ